MSYRINLTDRARKQLIKLDMMAYQQVVKAIEQISSLESPRNQGKPLVGTLKGCWRYRAGDYRILTKIIDTELLILVIEISHRKDVHR